MVGVGVMGFCPKEIPMSNHVLAIQPQLAVEPGEQEAHQAAAEYEWNQEQEVHARSLPQLPENRREQLQRLLPAMDLKRLIL